MRRGLLAWSEVEVPPAVLDSRVARLQGAMAEAGLDAVLVYTSFPRPAGVSFLTHFVPYWSQGLLAVFPDGEPVLLVSLSKRVANWIEETSKVSEIVCTPAIGRGAATLIAGRAPGAKRIGVVELSRLPGGIGQPLQAGLASATLEDASDLFRRIRHPADAAETALSSRAAAIAGDALDGLAQANPANTGAAIELLEAACRQAGAEDVLILIAPDLTRAAALQRLEGVAPLGSRYGIRLSVAYKGHWVRLQRSFAAACATDGAILDGIETWVAEALPRLRDGSKGLSGLTENGSAPGGLKPAAIVAEACIGCAPLTELSAMPAGAVVNVSISLTDSSGGWWLAGGPVLLADRPGQPARALTPG